MCRQASNKRTLVKNCVRQSVAQAKIVLLFNFLQLFDLLRELGDGVLLFLANRGDLSLVLDVGFLEVAPQLLQLRLALLVHLDLRLRCSARLVQPLTQLIHLALQLHALLLDLSNKVSKV